MTFSKPRSDGSLSLRTKCDNLVFRGLLKDYTTLMLWHKSTSPRNNLFDASYFTSGEAYFDTVGMCRGAGENISY